MAGGHGTQNRLNLYRLDAGIIAYWYFMSMIILSGLDAVG